MAVWPAGAYPTGMGLAQGIKRTLNPHRAPCRQAPSATLLSPPTRAHAAMRGVWFRGKKASHGPGSGFFLPLIKPTDQGHPHGQLRLPHTNPPENTPLAAISGGYPSGLVVLILRART